MAVAVERRHVSNEEYAKAFSDSDNKGVINKVLNQYRGTLPEHERESAGMAGLWRALQCHDEKYGQKFTTSLYQFVNWVCLHRVRKQKRIRSREQSLESIQWEPSVQANIEKNEDVRQVFEFMKFLSNEQQQIVREYYLDNRTMEEIGYRLGYSKEATRQKLSQATARIRELCDESGVLVFQEEDNGNSCN